MPIISGQAQHLRAVGPIIDVEIGPVPAVASTLVTVIPPIKILALIDTGASRSVIQSGIAQKLGLRPAGTKIVDTASSHGFRCALFLLRMTILPMAGIQVPINFSGYFAEAPLVGKRFQCLIGRAFLSKAVLTYVGPTNSFVLSM